MRLFYTFIHLYIYLRQKNTKIRKKGKTSLILIQFKIRYIIKH